MQAKIDYDTLYIYTNSKDIKNLIKDQNVSTLIMKLAKSKLKIPILEILTLEIDEDYSVSFQEQLRDKISSILPLFYYRVLITFTTLCISRIEILYLVHFFIR